jgi:hypothetical protein
MVWDFPNFFEEQWLLSPRRIAAPEFSRGFKPTVDVIFIPRRVSDD